MFFEAERPPQVQYPTQPPARSVIRVEATMTHNDLTIKQAAVIFGCSTQTVQAWIKAGRIKAYRLGETGSYRIPGAEVERVRAEWAYKPDTSAAL